MHLVRFVYQEEVEALERLFYLTERRNAKEPDDYVFTNGYIMFKGDISLTLSNILSHLQVETIWAPIWVEGAARGLFSDQADLAADILGLPEIPKIRWWKMFGQVVFIDRNDYITMVRLLQNSNKDYLFLQGVSDKKKIVTGLFDVFRRGDFYRVPQGVTHRMIESYLLNDTGFILEPDPNLVEKIKENYFATRAHRVPGGRRPVMFADLGVDVRLDSLEELLTYLYPNLRKKVPSGIPLHFPPNPNLSKEENEIWVLPVPLGEEDIHLELSFYRITHYIDEEYILYRENRLFDLDIATRYLLTKKKETKKLSPMEVEESSPVPMEINS